MALHTAPPSPPAEPGRLRAIVGLRCPRCRHGRIFSGLLRTHKACPTCGLRFEREPGYFVGAMYLSYALAVPAYLLLVIAIRLLLPRLPFGALLAVAALPLALLAPVLFRYSRVVWIHLDRALHPEEGGEGAG